MSSTKEQSKKENRGRYALLGIVIFLVLAAFTLGTIATNKQEQIRETYSPFCESKDMTLKEVTDVSVVCEKVEEFSYDEFISYMEVDNDER